MSLRAKRGKPDRGLGIDLRRAKCTRRTHSRGATRPMEYPVFHYSIIPPSQSGVYRATSPRCPASGNKPICPPERGSGAGKGVVQTNPIPAIMVIRRSAFPGGRIVRNKANFGRATWHGYPFGCSLRAGSARESGTSAGCRCHCTA
jgi:hypothetical protein